MEDGDEDDGRFVVVAAVGVLKSGPMGGDSMLTSVSMAVVGVVAV